MPRALGSLGLEPETVADVIFVDTGLRGDRRLGVWRSLTTIILRALEGLRAN